MKDIVELKNSGYTTMINTVNNEYCLYYFK